MKQLTLHLLGLALLFATPSHLFATLGPKAPKDEKAIKEAAKAVGLEYSLYPVVNSLHLRFAYVSEDNRKIILKIKDNHGRVILKNVYADEHKAKYQYSLEQFGAGIYTVSIAKAGFIDSRQIAVGMGDTDEAKGKVLEKTFDFNLYPVLGQPHVRFNYQTTSSKKVRVWVYNKDRKLVFEDVRSGAQKGKLSYDFSKLGSGEYEIVVRQGKFVAMKQLIVGEKQTEVLNLAEEGRQKRATNTLFKFIWIPVLVLLL